MIPLDLVYGGKILALMRFEGGWLLPRRSEGEGGPAGKEHLKAYTTSLTLESSRVFLCAASNFDFSNTDSFTLEQHAVIIK